MNKIKYCIWDVGEVIYSFSLRPLHQWCQENTNTPQKLNEKLGHFNYNDYMKGLVSFSDLCKELCTFYDITYSEKYDEEINKALHSGVGKFFQETRQAQQELLKKGIKNCILSNALPALADTADCQNIVEPEHIFCSFDLGLLKPDAKIYQTVLEHLNCTAEEVIFVDDKPENTKAAAKLGIDAITFNHQTIIEDIRRYIK